MSIYICGICQGMFDADYEGCFDNPNDPCGNLCENCASNIEYEAEERKRIHSERKQAHIDTGMKEEDFL